MGKHRTSSGFSLIEMLIVIVIILLLATILLPIFAVAREKALQTSCVNNMKQIGIAVSQYIMDYDGKLVTTAPTTSSTSIALWTNKISPYLYGKAGRSPVLNCPGVQDFRLGYALNRCAPEGVTTSTDPSHYLGRNNSVSLRVMICPEETVYFSDGGFVNTSLTNLSRWTDITPDPATVIYHYYGEAYATGGVLTPPGDELADPTGGFSRSTMRILGKWSSFYQRPLNRHNGGFVVLYFDGHARWLPIEILKNNVRGSANYPWDNIPNP